MASRKEEKERARQARIEAEQAAAAQAARARRVRMAGGGVLGVVVVVAAVVAIAAGSSGGGTGGSTTNATAPAGVKLPAQKIADLTTAAKAASCTLIDTPQSISWSGNNRNHLNPGTKITYKTNPPSWGNHYPAPASDGVYAPGKTPQLGYLVHAMEHGRVEYQYSANLPKAEYDQLLALYNEQDGTNAPTQYLLLFQNTTHMPYAVAATAWSHVMGCKTWTPATIDALRDFRIAYSFKAPETAFTGPE